MFYFLLTRNPIFLRVSLETLWQRSRFLRTSEPNLQIDVTVQSCCFTGPTCLHRSAGILFKQDLCTPVFLPPLCILEHFVSIFCSLTALNISFLPFSVPLQKLWHPLLLPADRREAGRKHRQEGKKKKTGFWDYRYSSLNPFADKYKRVEFVEGLACNRSHKGMKKSSLFKIAFSVFIANTYTKDVVKTVQIHFKIAGWRWGGGRVGGGGPGRHWFFDTERKGNGACGAERMDGPPGGRTETSQTDKLLTKKKKKEERRHC